ncbi:MAG: glycosyltransferase [Candidatus Polarisedimenticolaceae bacterium]|nr:glycosyltransferase [Candidatus Polarisedimenticolaceae bacterium]
MNQDPPHPCDIILPVYNGLSYVKECISSIIEYTDREIYHLYIVDDCSDTVTERYLLSIAKKHQNITLIRNETNIGFLKSCNKGIEQSDAEYVLLINSDVVVVENWLDRLLACADSDLDIASVNPLTNHASQISIPISSGSNFISMDWSIRQMSHKQYPDVVTGVGFCMLLRRLALDNVGMFDEIYGHGYCEESDLCMRLTTSGYRTVVADDVYLFHKGSASFGDRDERYINNRKIFDERWLSIYKEQYKLFQKADSLAYLRNSLKAPQRWSPLTSMRETYRNIRNQYQANNYIGAAKAAVRGILNLPFHTENIVSSEYVERLSRPGRLKVTYVLHNLTVAGGVLSVVQLVNELILLGVEARIVALYQYPETKQWKSYTCPIIFKNENELIANFPQSDIAVATHWTTAGWVSKVLSTGRAKTGVYFLQDYESWFFPESDVDARTKVKNTYSMIEHKIVKSSWLQKLIQTDGYQSEKIWLGMDLGVFYPRDVIRSGNPAIVAMARPRTPRRGFSVLIDALAIVKNRLKNVDIFLFGDDLSNKTIPFEFFDKGIISNQSQLAELYSASDIFIDASDFQGFGRTALEAMACHTACILTDVGGVTEYAKNEDNCILVPPHQPEKVAHAVFKLLDDDNLRAQITKGGSETASKFSHKEEAKKTLTYFRGL